MTWYSEEDLIPAILIKEYVICPRIVYFREVLGYIERTTASMEEGKEIHIKEDRKEKRRFSSEIGRVKKKWRNLRVSSHILGIMGVVDLVIETDEGLAVVETKNAIGGKHYRKNHLYQAVAYALLAEETLGKPIRFVILRYLKDGRKFRITITDELRNHVKWMIKKIRRIIDEGILPSFRKRPFCTNCGYKNVCRRV